MDDSSFNKKAGSFEELKYQGGIGDGRTFCCEKPPFLPDGDMSMEDTVSTFGVCVDIYTLSLGQC